MNKCINQHAVDADALLIISSVMCIFSTAFLMGPDGLVFLASICRDTNSAFLKDRGTKSCLSPGVQTLADASHTSHKVVAPVAKTFFGSLPMYKDPFLAEIWGGLSPPSP